MALSLLIWLGPTAFVVQPGAGLQLGLTADKGALTFKVTNALDRPINDVTASLILPVGSKVINTGDALAEETPDGIRLSWQVGELKSKETRELVFKAKVAGQVSMNAGGMALMEQESVQEPATTFSLAAGQSQYYSLGPAEGELVRVSVALSAGELPVEQPPVEEPLPEQPPVPEQPANETSPANETAPPANETVPPVNESQQTLPPSNETLPPVNETPPEQPPAAPPEQLPSNETGPTGAVVAVDQVSVSLDSDTESNGNEQLIGVAGVGIGSQTFSLSLGASFTAEPRLLIESGSATTVRLERVTLTWLKPTKITVTGSTLIQAKQEVAYEEVESDPTFDVTVDSQQEDNGILTVVFHHNAPGARQIRVDGDVEWALDKEAANSGEPVTLTISDWHNQYFELIVGNATEVLGFGTPVYHKLEGAVKDAKGSDVPADIEFASAATGKVRHSSTGATHAMSVREGRYNMHVKPEAGPVKDIEFENITVEADVALPKIDELPASGEFVQAYAIDPTAVNFTTATVTVIAKGNVLLKCKEWDFANEQCTGEWVQIQSITPGEEYSFTLTPDDPGFVETSQLMYNLFNTADPQYPAYYHMDNATVGGTRYTSAAVSLTPTGRRCWTNKWIAPAFDGVQTWVNGTWNFGIYAYCSNTGPTAYLFARILKYNGTEYNPFNTTSDDQNICGDISSPGTLRSWTFSMPYNYYLNLTAGERIGVQICVNVTTSASRSGYIQWESTTASNVVLPNASVNNPPIGSRSAQNTSEPAVGDAVLLSAYWTDDKAALDDAILSTNETGSWQNKTGVYGSPLTLSGTGVWSNFTWQNASVAGGTVVGWRIWANDSRNQFNVTDIMNFTVTSDTIKPQWSDNATSPASPVAYSRGASYQFNITWMDNKAVDDAVFEFDGANYTVSKSGNEYYRTFDGIAAGSHNYRWYANDTSNNWNSTSTLAYIINKASTNVTLTTAPATNVTYGNATITTCTDDNAEVAGNLYRNDTLANSENGTAVVLPVGTWTYVCNVTSIQNYTAASTNATYTIRPAAPSVVLISPIAGANFTINGTVQISANITSVIGVDGVIANVTFPNGTVESVPLSNVSRTYSASFTDLTLKGRYNITFIANDTIGNVNSSVTTFFNRVSFDPNNTVDITNGNQTPMAATVTVLGNASGLLTLQVIPAGQTIKRIVIVGYPQNDPHNVIEIENSTNDVGFRQTYSIDLSGLNATYTNVTVTSGGATLYKCTEFNSTSRTCTGGWDEFMLGNVPGQNYTITLNSTDPGFGDVSPDVGTPDSGLYITFGDGFSSTVNTFTSTQANDGAYFAVRRNNGAGAQLDLNAYLNLSYNLTNLSSQGVTPSKILNFTFNMSHCYNADIAGAFTCGGAAPGGTISTNMPIQLFNWTSGLFQTIGVYNGSPIVVANVTANVTSGFADFINTTTNFVTIRYVVNVTIVVNGNDAAFGVDYATLTVAYDNIRPKVTNVTTNPATINQTQTTVIMANVTDEVAVGTVLANITYPNGTSSVLVPMPLLSGNLYRGNFTPTLTDPTGIYIVTIIANDTHNNVNNTVSTNFTVNAGPDTQPPRYFNLTVSPASPVTYSPGVTYSFNATWTDNINISIVLLEFNGANYTASRIGLTNIYNRNFSDLAGGNYSYRWYANDTSNNWNSTGVQTYTINPALNPVDLFINGNRNQNVTITYKVQSNATGTGAGATLFRNDAAVANPDIATLGAGTYNYKVNATGNVNYSANATGLTFNLTVNRFNTTASLTFSPLSPTTYGTPTTASCSSNNTEAVANLYRDGVLANSENATAVVLGVNTYNYTCNVTQTQNYTAASNSSNYTVNKAASTVRLFINGNEANVSQVYGANSNATATLNVAGQTFQLYRNSTQVANSTSPISEVITLAAGVYNYTATWGGNANYSASNQTWFLNVTRATPILTLSSTGGFSLTYPASSNVSCTADTNQVTPLLYRNSTNVTNPELAQLAAGVHGYTCNNTVTQNYSSTSTSNILNISKASSSITLLLNGSSANLTAEVFAAVNHTALLVTPSSGTVELWKNNSLLASGASPLINLSSYGTLGTFNVTAVYLATQNYTMSNQTWWVTSRDTTVPVVTLISPSNGTNSSNSIQNFRFNVTDNFYSTLDCTLYINGVASGRNATTNASQTTTLTNSSVPEGVDSWYVSCTDGSTNAGSSVVRTITVDLTAPVITLIRPTQGEIVGYTVLLDADVTDNLLNVNTVRYEISNTSGILVSGVLPPPDYQANWNSTTAADGNYTFRVIANDTVNNSATSSANFTVDNIRPSVQIIRPTNGTAWNGNFSLNITFQNTRLKTVRYNITDSNGVSVQSAINSSVNSPTFAYTDVVNVNSLSAGNYMLTANATDVPGSSDSAQVLFIIDKITPAYFNLVEPADPSIYSPGAPYQFNATWTDFNGVGQVVFEFNGTNYTDAFQNGNVYSKTLSDLAVGTYNWKWYARDIDSNWNSTTTNTFTVAKAPTAPLVFLNGAQADAAQTYGSNSNATALMNVSTASFQLLRNGTAVASGTGTLSEVNTLAAGAWNYTAYFNGSANYTASNLTRILTISRAAPVLSLNAIPGFTVNYPTTTNVSCAANTVQISPLLFRDGASVSNPEVIGLAAGSYGYECNNTATQNYTAASSTNTLTVNKASSSITLLLNGTAANLTSEVFTAVNHTAVLNTPTIGTVELWKNGNLLSSGSSPLIQISGYSSIGDFNITAVYPATLNYTQSSQTWWVRARDTTAPVVTLVSPANRTNSSSQSHSFQFNVTDNYYNSTSCTLRINGIDSGNATATNATLTTIINNSVPEGTNSWLVRCTDGSANAANSQTRALTIDLTAPSITLVRPVSGQIVGFNVTLDADVTDALVVVDTVRYEISNSSGVQVNGILASPSYQAVWNSSTVADGSYTFTVTANDSVNNTAVASAAFIVDNTRPFIEIRRPLNGTVWSFNFNLDVGLQNTRLNRSSYNITNSTGGVIQNGTNNSINQAIFNWTNLVNVSALPTGTYMLTVFALDSVGINSTVNSNFSIDRTPPFFFNLNESQADPSIYSSTRNYQFNATWIDSNGIGQVILQFGGTNYTDASNQGNVWYRSFTGLVPANYTYRWYGQDNAGNWNATGNQSFTVVNGNLSVTLTAPTGTPRYFEGQSIPLRAYVQDGLGAAVTGATVTFEPQGANATYLCSGTVDEGAGFYKCGHNSAGMINNLTTYAVRVNASSILYNTTTVTNSSVFMLDVEQRANLSLAKSPSVSSNPPDTITYNVSLLLSQGRGTTTNTNLTDSDAGQTWNIGTLAGSQSTVRSFSKSYNRTAVEQTIVLAAATAAGFDNLYNTTVTATSNAPTIIVPENESAVKLTLTKNLVFLDQNTTAATYRIEIGVVNSGNADLTGIQVTDTDIGLDTTVNLTEGSSTSMSGNITLPKFSQSYTKNFVASRAAAGSNIFYSNTPSVLVPGFGGPYDVIITSLPGSVTTGQSITGIIDVFNTNTEIAEDRVLRTWIQDGTGFIYDLDVRTIYTGRGQHNTTQVTLTAPSNPGTYLFASEITWPTATANASHSFQVVAAAAPAAPGAGGAPVPIISENVSILTPGVFYWPAESGPATSELREGGQLIIGYNGVNRSLTVLKVYSNGVALDIDAGRIVVGIRVGEEKQIDIDNNGLPDVSIGLDRAGATAVLRLRLGKEVVPAGVPKDLTNNLIALRNSRNQIEGKLAELRASGVDTRDLDTVLSKIDEEIGEAELMTARGQYDVARNIVSSTFVQLGIVRALLGLGVQPFGGLSIWAIGALAGVSGGALYVEYRLRKARQERMVRESLYKEYLQRLEAQRAPPPQLEVEEGATLRAKQHLAEEEAKEHPTQEETKQADEDNAEDEEDYR